MMTWHTFFTLPFGQYPHNLFFAYAAVWTIQGGYLAWIAVQWGRAARKRSSAPGAASAGML
jgi:hypothetical protein